MIQLYDDVLDSDLLEYLNRNIKKELSYKPHGSVNKETFLWSDNIIDISFYQYLFDKFLHKINFFKNNQAHCIRAYVNLYPYAVGGDWHKDGSDNSKYTLMYYPQRWQKKFKGDTLFKNNINKVEYKENRLVFFKGDIEHKADKHYNEEFRFTLVYKIL